MQSMKIIGAKQHETAWPPSISPARAALLDYILDRMADHRIQEILNANGGSKDGLTRDTGVTPAA